MIQAPEQTEVMMSNLFWLTDVQLERLRPFFLKSRGTLRQISSDGLQPAA